MISRIRVSECALLLRGCGGMLIALLTSLLAGCIVLPANAKVDASGHVQAAPDGIALSVLFAYDFSPETPRRLGAEIVECVTRGLADAAREVRLVPAEEFHRAVFGVKPGEVLLRAETIETLLARPDIRQRVDASGLTHLILVRGVTHHHSGTSVFGGVGGYGGGIAGGWANATRSTQLTASIFELATNRKVGVQASAEGSQGVGMVLPLFLGWVHATESAACDALGAEVARAIRGQPRDESR